MGIGVGEILLLLILAFLALMVFVVFYFISKYLGAIGGKACPYCAEKIKAAAKICRFCQRDVSGV
jgi:hypothetical protein